MVPLRSRTSIAIALLTIISTAPARAETFTVFVYETAQELSLRADKGPRGKAYWDAFATFADVLQTSGAMRGGAPLALPAEAVTFSAAGRRVGVKPQNKLSLSGYFQIEAPTLADAERLAAQVPSVKHGGRAEVRASYPAPTMTVAH